MWCKKLKEHSIKIELTGNWIMMKAPSLSGILLGRKYYVGMCIWKDVLIIIMFNLILSAQDQRL